MKVWELATPAFLVDLTVLESNIRAMAALCRENGVELWPMVKTHKSTAIAQMQRAAGAKGLLTGTVDEAEYLVEQGFDNIMLAYPVAAPANVARVVALARRAGIIIGLDGAEAAGQLNKQLADAGLMMEYLLIIDCGLRRFGVSPDKAAELAASLAGFSQLRLGGIATHPGQVYGATGYQEVEEVAKAEIEALAQVKLNLERQGFAVKTVATGSTPTAPLAVKAGLFTALQPGNYVFYDNIQVALGVAKPAQCALTVLATVVSRPRPDTFLIDAGSKCLGLDKGAHGNSLLQGFGQVAGHPELLVASLSEEVGRVQILADTTLAVGDKIRIIPNHSCSSANFTNWLVGHRDDAVEKLIPVDMRGGTRRRWSD